MATNAILSLLEAGGFGSLRAQGPVPVPELTESAEKGEALKKR